MLLVIGTAALALAVLSFSMILLGSRNPQTPAWANDNLVGNLYLPLIIGVGVLGIGCFFKVLLSLGSQPPSGKAWAVSVAIVAASLLLLRSMSIKKRLAKYAAMKPTADVIKPAVFMKEKPGAGKPGKPVKPRSTRKKAA